MTEPTPLVQWKVTMQSGGVTLNQTLTQGDYTSSEALAFARQLEAEARKGAAAHAVGMWLLSHGMAQDKVLAAINDLVARHAGSPALLQALAPIINPEVSGE